MQVNRLAWMRLEGWGRPRAAAKCDSPPLEGEGEAKPALENDASRLIHKGGISVDMALWSCRMSDRGPIIPGNRPAAEKPRSQERATDHGPS